MPDDDSTLRRGERRALLLLSYVGFVSLGLPDSVLGAAWPAIRGELELPLAGAGWVVLLAMIGTVLSSSFSGHVLARVTPGWVLALSTLLAGSALAIYACASSAPWLLVAAGVAGLGGGAIDAVLNRFVAQHYSVRHMTWLHGCWGVGATLGPLSVAAMLHARHSWRLAYVALAVVEMALALAFLATRSQWRAAESVAEAASARASTQSVPASPTLTAGMRASIACFWLYCGIEAGVGLWGASLLIETRGASVPLAGSLLSVYWGMLTAGRFAFGAVAERLGPARLLVACCSTALGALLALCVPGTPLAVAAGAIALLGLALAPIYPLLMHETPRRFGDDASRWLVGYQVAAGGVGIAVLPWLLGLCAERGSLLLVPPLLAVLAALLLLANRIRQTVA